MVSKREENLWKLSKDKVAEMRLIRVQEKEDLGLFNGKNDQ